MQAIPYWQQAGQRAGQRSAYVEAITHLTKGLELLKVLPDTPERAEQELMLQVAMGVPLQATKGYAAPEVQNLYAHARELCQRLGETRQLFPVALGLWVFFLVRGQYQTARELGEQLFSMAQRRKAPPLLLEAHSALGQTLCWQGEFAPARAHLERGLAYYTPQQRHSHPFFYGLDPGAVCLSYTAWVLWHLGYPDQALQKIDKAFILTRELSHSFSLVFVLVCSMFLHQLRREVQLVRERAEAVIAQGDEQGFPQFLAWGSVWRGWVLALQEEGDKGIAQIRQGIAAYRSTGGEATWPYCLALLAEAHEQMGQTEEGISVLNEALTILDRTGEGFYEAEVYRLKGELLVMRNHLNAAQAKTCFQRAIEIARRQGANPGSSARP